MGLHIDAVLAIVFALLLSVNLATGANTNLNDLDYRVYPRRTSEEAAVLEWGHSAIISAVDASVAQFGPQSAQAALMEVECQPVLASPLNGQNTETGKKVEELENSDEIHGNMAVMTFKSSEGVTGAEMARLAKKSGAAALCVVNVDDEHPDDIFSLPAEGDMDDIDIPVVMISLNSANILTTATVTPDMKASEIINHGMPERVRMYATDDRPFFEDVEPAEPTLYLIHNLLSEEECDALVDTAQSKVSPVVDTDLLQLLEDGSKASNVERVVLWKGALKGPSSKEVDERMEQVTGFPVDHYSDFVVSKFDAKSSWAPHFDSHPRHSMMATVTVFLQDGGPEIVYPSISDGEPVKITPRKGLAVVHHNTIHDRDNEQIHRLDSSSLHAFLPSGKDGTYIAQKHVFFLPLSPTRRIVLPFLALPFGGKLPQFVVKAHDLLVEKFGTHQGSRYFDKLAMFLPLAIIGGIAQLVSNIVRDKLAADKKKNKKKETQSNDKRKKGKTE